MFDAAVTATQALLMDHVARFAEFAVGNVERALLALGGVIAAGFLAGAVLYLREHAFHHHTPVHHR